MLNGETISSIDLISGANREYTTTTKLKEKISSFLNAPNITVILIVIIIMLLILIRSIYITIKRRNLRKRRPMFK